MMLRLPAVLLTVFLLSTHCASGSYPKAQNVTWKSTNFKTILTWEPKPSDDYSYTVELSAIGKDIQKFPHCTQSLETTCDVTNYLTDLKVNYAADILSVPRPGVHSDLIEFPHTSSPRFCPYNDTDIGRPDFELKVSEDKKTTTLYVSDPLIALFKDGRQLTIRDIFGDRLQYRITYWKNKSTGKKVYNSKANVTELTDLDKGKSYCFNVQAYIPSRRTDKQLGEMSQAQCTKDDDQSILEVYSVRTIAVTVVVILVLIAVIIAVTVICCRRRKKALKNAREGVPPEFMY